MPMRIYCGGLPGFLPGHRSTPSIFSRFAIVSRSHHTAPSSTWATVMRDTPLRRDTSATDQPLSSITLRSLAATSCATRAPWWSSSTACGHAPSVTYSAGLRRRLSPRGTAKSVAHPALPG
jgi:hypothetical protein